MQEGLRWTFWMNWQVLFISSKCFYFSDFLKFGCRSNLHTLGDLKVNQNIPALFTDFKVRDAFNRFNYWMPLMAQNMEIKSLRGRHFSKGEKPRSDQKFSHEIWWISATIRVVFKNFFVTTKIESPCCRNKEIGDEVDKQGLFQFSTLANRNNGKEGLAMTSHVGRFETASQHYAPRQDWIELYKRNPS